MPARFHVAASLAPGVEFALPAGAARHVQVLRLQTGAPVTLFDGRGGEWSARVTAIGRSDVRVRVEAFDPIERELALHVTLAIGMPANERMDSLVEKASELGVAAIQPLHCARSVLRLTAERATRKVRHWQGVASSACEQSGRTRVPQVTLPLALADWLAALAPARTGPQAGLERRLLLSLRDAQPLARIGAVAKPPLPRKLIALSGPEGGLTEDEEHSARQCGFVAVSLGPRTLRADTAPLALLALLAACAEVPHQGRG